MLSHTCPQMERAIEESDEDRPFWEICVATDRGWSARNHKGGIPIQFCPFCGIDLNTIPPSPAWCTSCNSPCHCGPRNGHDCVHPKEGP